MAKKPLGFVVEGRSDQTVLVALMRQVLPDRDMVIISAGGKATMQRSHEHVQELLDAGCEHVFVVLDRDDDDVDELEEELTTVLRRAGIKRSMVTLASPNPTIEAWLVTEAQRRDHTAKRAVELCLQKGDSLESLAAKAQFDDVAKRDPDLRGLLDKLRSFAKSKKSGGAPSRVARG